MQVFPDHSIDTLQKALRQCEMDAEVAALLLLDNNTEALFVCNCSDNDDDMMMACPLITVMTLLVSSVSLVGFNTCF